MRIRTVVRVRRLEERAKADRLRLCDLVGARGRLCRDDNVIAGYPVAGTVVVREVAVTSPLAPAARPVRPPVSVAVANCLELMETGM